MLLLSCVTERTSSAEGCARREQEAQVGEMGVRERGKTPTIEEVGATGLRGGAGKQKVVVLAGRSGGDVQTSVGVVPHSRMSLSVQG